jgi:DNA invertase Pin-like site-specific DNA recombinase
MPSPRSAAASTRSKTPPVPRFVSYLRVSTARQGASGLGLEAQREAVSRHIAAAGPSAVRLAEFVEIESGKRDDRPELEAAIEEAQLSGAVLVIAKLDRLSRDAHFLLGLQKAGIEFVACDIPQANRLTIGVLAVVAQHEREMIAERTKAALGARKAALAAERAELQAAGKAAVRTLADGRVVPLRLGNPNGARCLAGIGNVEAVAAVKERAGERAERLRKRLAVLDPSGMMSARGLAQVLNDRGIPSPRQGLWTAQSVIRLRARLAG